LAAENHYPAVDVLKSISRVMNNIIQPDHYKVASKVRQMMAKYKEIELLVKIGEYKKGMDPAADEAISKIEAIKQFLMQGIHETSDFNKTLNDLSGLVQA
jgi:type III secretion protein N (ATPase)